MKCADWNGVVVPCSPQALAAADERARQFLFWVGLWGATGAVTGAITGAALARGPDKLGAAVTGALVNGLLIGGASFLYQGISQ